MLRWQGFSRLNLSGDPAPAATVSVYNTRTTQLATLYGANNLTVQKPNPFILGTDGFGFFYAANGRYDIQFSGGGITTPYSLGDYALYDPGSIGS